MAALTITWDSTQGNKSMAAAQARGFGIQAGTIALGSTYATGGLSVNMSRFASVQFVSIPPASGLVFEYDYTNEKVRCFEAGTTSATNTVLAANSTLQEVASDIIVDSWVAVRFLAWGT